MKLSRLFLPLFCALALLFTQQAGAAHALNHALEQQQDKQSPHSQPCEKCEHFAQLGSALQSNAFEFKLPALSSEAAVQLPSIFPSNYSLAAAARGPPASFQQTF